MSVISSNGLYRTHGRIQRAWRIQRKKISTDTTANFSFGDRLFDFSLIFGIVIRISISVVNSERGDVVDVMIAIADGVLLGSGHLVEEKGVSPTRNAVVVVSGTTSGVGGNGNAGIG